MPYDRICMHEFVLSGARMRKEHGVRTLDIAKRLLDYGYHPPTIYFPLIVDEAMMIEPTETESKETLDRFAEVLLRDRRRGRGRSRPRCRARRTRRRCAGSTRPLRSSSPTSRGGRGRMRARPVTATWRLVVDGAR